MQSFHITPGLTDRVWKKLADGDVPGVVSPEGASAVEWATSINKDLSANSYMPSVVHGYLGVEKHFGVTRFIPIITKEDMAVYYHLCSAIGGRVIVDVENIYGGWRSIPRNIDSRRRSNTRAERWAQLSEQNYYSAPFSSAAWFQQFKSFNDAIRHLVGSGAVGNYVVKTDVANFYDSIDVGRLTRKLRSDAPDFGDYINILEVFLGYWNRRTSGYQQSSRGIPQEIISDGSRNLSHYYLQDFDARFISYCSSLGLIYLRWADDILVFGPSVKQLEAAVHHASRFLLADGLNLNAAKTKVFSRREFEKYRGLRALDAIERRNQTDFRRELGNLQRAKESEHVKIDTIFRATIGFTALLPAESIEFERAFIFETLRKNPSLIGGLNNVQLFRIIKISVDPLVTFLKLVRIVCGKEVTAPKASMLTLLRMTSSGLAGLGIKKEHQLRAIIDIEASSGESEILSQFCIPQAASAVDRLL